jgi:hypothetical protein
MTDVYHQNLTPWRGERIGDIRLPANIGAVWPDDDLAAVGLYRAYPPAEIPEGKQVSANVEWDGTGVRYVLEDSPPPPWPELSQRQFWKVLALAGMHAEVMAAVDALPLEDQIEAKQAMSYQQDHWLIAATRPAFDLDDAQFRDLWYWGATL